MKSFVLSTQHSALSPFGVPAGALDRCFFMVAANSNRRVTCDADIVSMGYRLSTLLGIKRALASDYEVKSETFVSLSEEVAASIGGIVSDMVKSQPNTQDGHKLRAYAARYAKRHGIG